MREYPSGRVEGFPALVHGAGESLDRRERGCALAVFLRLDYVFPTAWRPTAYIVAHMMVLLKAGALMAKTLRQALKGDRMLIFSWHLQAGVF